MPTLFNFGPIPPLDNANFANFGLSPHLDGVNFAQLATVPTMLPQFHPRYSQVWIVGSEIYDFYDFSFFEKSSGNQVMSPGVSNNVKEIWRRF